jgi:hypothetical protein
MLLSLGFINETVRQLGKFWKKLSKQIKIDVGEISIFYLNVCVEKIFVKLGNRDEVNKWKVFWTIAELNVSVRSNRCAWKYLNSLHLDELKRIGCLIFGRIERNCHRHFDLIRFIRINVPKRKCHLQHARSRCCFLVDCYFGGSGLINGCLA